MNSFLTYPLEPRDVAVYHEVTSSYYLNTFPPITASLNDGGCRRIGLTDSDHTVFHINAETSTSDGNKRSI